MPDDAVSRRLRQVRPVRPWKRPAIRRFFDGVNDDEIRETLAGLKRRGGLMRLLRLLGFPAPPQMRTPPRTLRVPARTLATTSRDTLRAHVLGVRGPFTTADLRDLGAATRAEEPFAHHVLIITEPACRRVVIACDALHDGMRHVVLEPSATRASDIETLRDLAALPGESGTAAALRIHRALDRRRLTHRFFRDIRAVRDGIARQWTGLPASASTERDALALLLLSRLMFLYFLQRRGLLNGDTQFLPRLFAHWRRRANARGTFYRVVLRTLFFGVLNRQTERRSVRARSLGELPYLNGGLFERHRLELRRPGLDIADEHIAAAFDALLEKYRFTMTDTAAPPDDDSIGAGIDPEMLGRIFEGLMPGDRRSRTGTFYTPADTVDALVVSALATHLSTPAGVPAHTVRGLLLGKPTNASDRDLRAVAAAARDVRVLDPACGSGAFLLGAMARLGHVRARAHRTDRNGGDERREIVARALHGVDLLEDAALICSLRLWLSLIPQCDRIADVPPLPNLDRRIRQGDALVDPLDVGAAYAGRPLSSSAPAQLRPLIARLGPASHAYLSSGPDTRLALRRSLASIETRLARAWLNTLEQQLDCEQRELHARAADLDLFGVPTSTAVAARSRLPATLGRQHELRTFRQDLHGARALPFFSFRVHFADVHGFDVVLSNPPWVRAHNWPPTVRQLLRERYRVCADAGWPYAADATATPRGAGAQVDLAFLFLERSIRLLRERGTLGMVLPAKLLRSLAPGGARALLLSDTRIASIEDHSLDQRAVFDADAFTAVIVAQRSDASVTDDSRTVRVRMTRGSAADLSFDMPVADLPLRAGDNRSPWLLAPTDCAAAFRTMQRAGTAIRDSDLTVRRGAMTGANDVMIVQHVEPKLGDIARIRTEGHDSAAARGDRRRFAGYVETSVLRPVLRGTDVRPWHARIERHVLYAPANDDSTACMPPRLGRFLHRHRERLRQQPGRLGTLQRLSDGMFGHKVVWSDLAADLRAAAVSDTVRCNGLDLPVVPLNTIYFIATSGQRESLLLAACLNSLPVRTFARAIAERAKDAHFRFFAWTVAVLPLPRDWRTCAAADRLIDISRSAHRSGCIEPRLQAELDMAIARAFGLDTDQIDAIAAFDAWLGGRKHRT